MIPINRRRTQEQGFLILFAEAGAVSGERPPPSPAPAPPEDADNARLAQELASTREYLQAVIEQQETANEELQSANEEVLSANEELQSSNEELETSKEEIQSSNEELATVNDELNNRNTVLNRLNNDVVNLLDSVQLAIVMLGPDLRLRRFTPAAEKLLNLIPADAGRPLADFNLNLDPAPDLRALLTEVIETVSTRQCELQDQHGRWYSLRLRPYKTQEHQIDGAVMVLVDIDTLKRSEQEIRQAEEALQQSHAELQSHVEELTRFNHVAVGRELRMIELKKDVNELCERHGEAARYPLEFEPGLGTQEWGLEE